VGCSSDQIIKKLSGGIRTRWPSIVKLGGSFARFASDLDEVPASSWSTVMAGTELMKQHQYALCLDR